MSHWSDVTSCEGATARWNLKKINKKFKIQSQNRKKKEKKKNSQKNKKKSRKKKEKKEEEEVFVFQSSE